MELLFGFKRDVVTGEMKSCAGWWLASPQWHPGTGRQLFNRQKAATINTDDLWQQAVSHWPPGHRSWNKMAEQLINLIAKKELLSNVCLVQQEWAEEGLGLGKHEWNFYLRGNQPFRDSKQQCFMWKSLGISITLVTRHCLFCTVHCSFGPSIYYIHILLPM